MAPTPQDRLQNFSHRNNAGSYAAETRRSGESKSFCHKAILHIKWLIMAVTDCLLSVINVSLDLGFKQSFYQILLFSFSLSFASLVVSVTLTHDILWEVLKACLNMSLHVRDKVSFLRPFCYIQWTYILRILLFPQGVKL